MKTILIIGASRGIGLETVRQALDQGYHVRAFARSASQIPITHAELTKVNGDALKAEDVAAAVKGADAVIETLGAKTSLAMFTSHTQLFSDATRILIELNGKCWREASDFCDGLWAGDSREHMSFLQRVPFELLLGRVYADKAVQEMMIRRSALSWVIARPGILTTVPEQAAIKSSISLPTGETARSRAPTSQIFLSSKSKMTPISARLPH